MAFYNKIVTWPNPDGMRNPVHVIANPATGGMWQSRPFPVMASEAWPSLFTRDHHGLLRSPRDVTFVIEEPLPTFAFSFAFGSQKLPELSRSKEGLFSYGVTSRLRAESANPLPLRLAQGEDCKISSISALPCESKIMLNSGMGWKAPAEYLNKKLKRMTMQTI